LNFILGSLSDIISFSVIYLLADEMLVTFIQRSSRQKRYENHSYSAADLSLNIGIKIDINTYKGKGYLDKIHYSE